jgi:flagellin-like hook-associated protein FlgL
MKQVDILQEQHKNTEDFLTEQLQELQGVDSAKAISDLKQNEAVLEANLSLLSRINQTSLLDFLR